ncbi:MAG: 16S rRNA (uracil(1498)-N(3))-methyltransferase [Verrucomicrobiota bacterium]
MPRCYANPSCWNEDGVTLGPEESHHLTNVLRLGPGQKVDVFDGVGREGEAEIVHLDRKRVELKVRSSRTLPDTGPALHLFQAVLKSQKMDLVIQKAVELGARTVIPVECERTVARIKPAQMADKTERWSRIALNAAKQCGANRLTGIEPVHPLTEVEERVDAYELFLVGALRPDAAGLKTLCAKRPKDVALLIGPEGDFSPAEYDRLEKAGARFASLGQRTLRAETAALYALSVLHYELS